MTQPVQLDSAIDSIRDEPIVPAPGSPPLAPVSDPQRIASIDVLRGFALLGILAMNIQSFSMIGAAYMNPTAYGDLNGANWWAWYLCHVLADMKMMSIFSMLFGAGIVIMTSRAEAAGRGSAAVHYRRMGWLLVFGLVHAYALWYGDILYTYAVCGLLAYLFRRLAPRWLVAIAIFMLMVPTILAVLFNLAFPYIPPENLAEMRASWLPPQDVVQEELEAYRGSWLDQMSNRAPMAVMFQTAGLLLFGFGFRAGGMILLGMALYKLGVFSATCSRRFYLGFVAVGCFIGVPLILYGVWRNVQAGFSYEYSMMVGMQFNYWGSVFVALGWVGVIMLLFQSTRTLMLWRPLAAVGQMALTNYLMQTIICTTIFYGHGLGYFGSIDRTGQLAIVIGVWALQLIVSPIWLHCFRFGPMEWLWRSLTYWQWQPLRRQSPHLEPSPA